MSRQNPCGYAVINYPQGKIEAHGTIKSDDKLDWLRRVYLFSDGLRKVISVYSPDMVCYELPFFMPRNPQTAIKLAHLCGCVVSVASLLHVPVMAVAPTEAKKALTGKGNSDKEQMIESGKIRWGLTLVSHECDAAAVTIVAYGRTQTSEG